MGKLGRLVEGLIASADKQAFREEIWEALRRAGAARFPGAKGRIPNFTGAEAAAERLAALPEWQVAQTVKCNPDSPQWPVRTRALADGKTLYMAVPRLRDEKPFIELDADRISGSLRTAASIKGASSVGRPVAIREMRHIDLIVCGTVAVDRAGARIGKGGGYSDLEFALLVEAGLVDDDTVIATTVHPLQMLDGELPETEHDFRVDLIVTPDEAIRAHGARRRPAGIIWDDLDDEKIDAIPVLRARRGMSPRDG